MPPKPTCKVVKREGQRGARIVKSHLGILVMPSNLLGVNAIKLLKSRYKVKFK